MTSPADAVAVLNRIHIADPSVLTELCSYRVPCNRTLADDPTVQVRTEPRTHNRDQVDDPKGEDTFQVGLLGILNGIFGSRWEGGPGYIGANVNGDNKLMGFVLLDTAL